MISLAEIEQDREMRRHNRKVQAIYDSYDAEEKQGRLRIVGDVEDEDRKDGLVTIALATGRGRVGYCRREDVLSDDKGSYILMSSRFFYSGGR